MNCKHLSQRWLNGLIPTIAYMNFCLSNTIRVVMKKLNFVISFEFLERGGVKKFVFLIDRRYAQF